MKQIENRKKLLKNLSNREIAKVANIQTLSSDGLAKAKRAAELQARITNALARKTPGALGLASGPQDRILIKMYFCITVKYHYKIVQK